MVSENLFLCPYFSHFYVKLRKEKESARERERKIEKEKERERERRITVNKIGQLQPLNF